MISVTDPPNPAQIMHLSFEKNDTFACLEFMQRISLLLLLTIFLAISASAQQSSEIGLSGGVSYYLGELNPGTPFVNPKPAFGIFYRKNLNTRLSVQLHYVHGSLSGDGDNLNFAPNISLSFSTPLDEIAAQFEVNFFDFSIRSKKNKLSPYIFGGVGVFRVSPSGASGVFLADPAKKSLTNPSFPFGLGVKYGLGRNIGLGIEWGMRKTFTDYIDGVSGDSRINDWYSFALVSISYKFRLFKKEDCLDQDKFRSQKRK